MRHPAIITAAVAAALATGGVLAVSGGAQQPGERTLKFVTKNCQFKLVDTPPRIRGRQGAPGAGDQFAISCQVFDEAGTTRKGTLDAACVLTRGGKRNRGVCNGTYALADGDVYLAARLTSTNTTSGAVTGGSKAYAGARGTFVSVDRPGEKGGDPSDDTVTLLP